MLQTTLNLRGEISLVWLGISGMADRTDQLGLEMMKIESGQNIWWTKIGLVGFVRVLNYQNPYLRLLNYQKPYQLIGPICIFRFSSVREYFLVPKTKQKIKNFTLQKTKPTGTKP